MRNRLAAWLAIGAGLAALGADDDPESLRPGLVATYRAGDPDRRPLPARVASGPAWDWGDGAPDVRLPADGFAVRWSGLLLVNTPGPHSFHARTEDEVRVTVDGKVALDGQGATARHTLVDLPPGTVPIAIEYRHARGPARLALDWEGPGFAREPLPPHRLYHDAEAEPAPDPFEQGRRRADRLGCANCHELLDLPRHPHLGPALDRAGRELDPSWLAAWLTDPGVNGHAPSMPGFGLEPGAAADLVAFLGSIAPARPPTAEARMALNVADPGRGQLLFRTLGCLACHTRGDEAGLGGRDLAGLGRKRSAEAVVALLARPKADVVGRHRPDLKLNADPAAHLAAYLTADTPPPGPRPEVPPADPARGRALARALRCAACHEVPGLAPPPPSAPPLRAGTDPGAGCLADQPQGEGVPRFVLSDGERSALRAFVGGLPAHPSPTPLTMKAEDVAARRGCFGCHTRNGQGGDPLRPRLAALLASDPDLAGFKGMLHPPDLAAVGDKLRPEALDAAIRGRAPVARPWLAVSMPVFPFEPGEAEGLAALFNARDRAPVGAEPPAPPRSPDAAAVEEAAGLIGRNGFGCVSCHVLAGKVPPGGEAETLGPDLALARRRMTGRYFRRWIADPQRILPGTAMPQFNKPAPGHAGTLDDQLATVWALLGSDRVAEVAAAGTRELLRRQGDRALVVRDMVVWPESPGPYLPRALAIGLKNGHSLLFDADRLAWAGGWRGGFLYRTKAGRLWEWHPDGEAAWLAPRLSAPVLFLDAHGQPAGPEPIRDRFGSFAELAFDGDGVTLRYQLHGPTGPPVRVAEHLAPTADGWERHVRLDALPAGFEPRLCLDFGPSFRPRPDGRGWIAKLGASEATLDARTEPDRTPPCALMEREGEGSYSATLRFHVRPVR